MKLALLCIDKTSGTPSLGLAYIASYLREHENFYDTIIIDKEDHLKRIKKENPDVVGISATTSEFSKAIKLSKEIKVKFDIPTMIGGHHISLLPQSISNFFDLGVIGEGEQTILELVQLYEKYGSFNPDKLKKIKGVIYHSNDNIKITSPRPKIEPLDSIPFPARDLLKMKEYYLKPRRLPHNPNKISIGTHIIPSRGCPYDCSFCSSCVFWGRRIRFFSPEYVVDEIKQLIENYKNINHISFFDDLFIASKNNLEKFTDLIKKEKLNDKLEFSCWGRTNLITNDICKLLKECNFKTIDFGFESGSDKVLQFLKGKSVSVEINRRAIKICKKYGLRVNGSFIVGSPDESKQDMELTYQFIKNSKIDSGSVYFLTPLPGTEIWKIAKEKGLVSDDMDWSVLNQKNIFFSETNKNDVINYYNKIVSELERRNYSSIKIEFKYLLSTFMIKKIIENPKMFLKFLSSKIIR